MSWLLMLLREGLDSEEGLGELIRSNFGSDFLPSPAKDERLSKPFPPPNEDLGSSFFSSILIESKAPSKDVEEFPIEALPSVGFA